MVRPGIFMSVGTFCHSLHFAPILQRFSSQSSALSIPTKPFSTNEMHYLFLRKPFSTNEKARNKRFLQFKDSPPNPSGLRTQDEGFIQYATVSEQYRSCSKKCSSVENWNMYSHYIRAVKNRSYVEMINLHDNFSPLCPSRLRASTRFPPIRVQNIHNKSKLSSIVFDKNSDINLLKNLTIPN